MKYRPLGDSGISASIVGLGAWVLGGGAVWGRDTDDAESVRAIHTALDLGVTLIDTAPAYGWGRSEEVVGRAIRGRRDRVVLATKCGLWWDDARGSFFTEFDGKKLYRSLRPDTIRIEVENSLRRLGTDRIDLYQTHWPSCPPEATPVADTMAVLLDLKARGKIRAIGAANVSPAEVEEYARSGPLASVQFRYSMLHREAEKELLPACMRRGTATITYMSLEQGLLTGRIGMDRVFTPGEFRSNAAWNDWLVLSNRRRVLDLLASWKDLTVKYACTLSQLVIAWTAAQPGVTHVLAGGRTPAQVAENAGAAGLTPDPADLARLRADLVALGDPLPA